MTPYEAALLRLRCVEIFVVPASRHGLENGQVFALAERAWQFVTTVQGASAPVDGHAATAAPKTRKAANRDTRP